MPVSKPDGHAVRREFHRLVGPAFVPPLARSGGPSSSWRCFLKTGISLAGSGAEPRGAAASISSKKTSMPPGIAVVIVRPGVSPTFWKVWELPRGAKTVSVPNPSVECRDGRHLRR